MVNPVTGSRADNIEPAPMIKLAPGPRLVVMSLQNNGKERHGMVMEPPIGIGLVYPVEAHSKPRRLDEMKPGDVLGLREGPSPDAPARARFVKPFFHSFAPQVPQRSPLIALRIALTARL